MSTSLLSLSVVLLSVSYCLYRSPPGSLTSLWSRLRDSRGRQPPGQCDETQANGDSSKPVSSARRPPTEAGTQNTLAAPGDRAQEGDISNQEPASLDAQTRNIPNNRGRVCEDDISETTPATRPATPPASAPHGQSPSEMAPARGNGQADAISVREAGTPALLSPTASEQMMPPPPRRPQRAVAPTSASLSSSAVARLPPSTSTSTSTLSSTLRVPSTGPLPQRGPPTNASTGNSSFTTSTFLATPATSSTLAPPSRSRRPVTLKPGHSPLDWAALIRSSQNLSGVARFTRVTPSELARNNGRHGKPAWAVYKGTVYNVTPYLDFHPGGKGELMRGAGNTEGERLFGEVHPWVNWENMLGACVVGMMVPEGDGEGLDGMD